MENTVVKEWIEKKKFPNCHYQDLASQSKKLVTFYYTLLFVGC